MLAVAAHSVPPFTVPQAAWRYKPDLTREAQKVFGEHAPIALLAAQIESESSWNPRAISPSGDVGLAQIGRNAHRYLVRIRPGPGPGHPRDPHWSIRAMLWFDWHLGQAIKGSANACEHWKFVLASYNGGLGWVDRERKLCRASGKCDPARWTGHSALYFRRSKAAFRENRGYVQKVIRRQAAYASWGNTICNRS